MDGCADARRLRALYVDRRKFLGRALGTLCAPSVAAAQAVSAYRIGWIDLSSAAEKYGMFEHEMAGIGSPNGQTFTLAYRSGDGRIDRLPSLAAELVRSGVDAIVAPGVPEVLAAKNATKTVPIVMAGVDDPVARGLVASLARPGRNVTGVARARRELNANLLSVLHELSPDAHRIAVLLVSDDPDNALVLADLRAAARKLNVSLNAIDVREYTDVEPAFNAIKRQGNGAVVVSSNNMLVPRWIADLALTHGLVLASTSPGYAYEGGVIAYTEDWPGVFARVARFVDRILKGAKPGDLPVELPSKFKLIVNARTARSLKLTIPQSILARADAVIG